MCLDQYERHYLNIQTKKVKYSNKESKAISDEKDDFICSNTRENALRST